MESRILIEEWSNICDAQAFVEETDTCTYFYIWFHPGKDNSFIKSCWICNNAEAKEMLDLDTMEEGMAPMMPAANVLHNRQGIHLQKDALEIMWFEEGDAAALLQGDMLLCVIPAWSGQNGFHGYSRYAKETSELACPMKAAENTLKQRVEKVGTFGIHLIKKEISGMKHRICTCRCYINFLEITRNIMLLMEENFRRRHMLPVKKEMFVMG